MNTGFLAKTLRRLLSLACLAAFAAAAHAEAPLDDYSARLAAPAATRAPALDAILAAGVVRIAVPQDLPPFGSSVPGGRLEGYDVDVAQLLARELGVRVQLVPVRSADRLSLLLTRRVDLVIASLGVSPERARAIAFSSPYAPFFSGVYGPPEIAAASLAELAGRKIAVTRDTLEDRELTARAPKEAQILRYPDNAATLAAYAAGEAELLATGSGVAAALAARPGARRADTKFILRASPASIGVARGEPELLHWVNVFVYHEKLNGELDRLSRKWLGQPLPALPAL